MDQGLKKAFHNVEKGLSHVKMDLVTTKAKIDAALSLTSREFMSDRAYEEEQLKKMLKKMENYNVTASRILYARASAHSVMSDFANAIVDLKQALHTSSTENGYFKMRCLISLALTLFMAQQWKESSEITSVVLKFKALPVHFVKRTTSLLHYCEYKLGNSSDKPEQLYLRFLSDDLLYLVFSYHDDESKQVMNQMTPFFRKFAQPKTEKTYLLCCTAEKLLILDSNLSEMATIPIASM